MANRIDPEVLAGFIEEARSYLPEILAGLDAYRRDAGDSAALAEAHRLVHSIKGAASMVGFAALGHIAFYLEQALEELAAEEEPGRRRMLGALVGGVTQIEGYLDAVAAGRLAERPFVDEVVRLFRRLKGLPQDGDEAEVERLLGPPARPAPAAAAAPAADAEALAAPEIAHAFLDEADEHLAAIGQGLSTLAVDPGAAHALSAVRRSVHTLKGAAALVGFGAVARLAHRMEDLLDHLDRGSAEPRAEVVELLFATLDAFPELLSSNGRQEEAAADLEELYGRYRQLLGEQASAGEPSAPSLDLADFPPLPAELTGELPGSAPRGALPAAPAVGGNGQPGPTLRVPLARLEELVRLVSELVVSRGTFEQHFGALSREVGELDLSVERLRRLGGRLESEYEAATLGGGGAVRPSEPFDALELDRYTEFHLLTRELAETGSDIATLGGELDGTRSDFDSYLSRLSRLTSEVQDKLMRLRMVPLATLAGRLHRAVRMTAAREGKAAELVLEGGAVELDKTVLEEMADPLLHLLRNAVDHGIEPPALRRALGKSERGSIVVRATYEGTQVVIRISDDGAGVEPERVRRAAVDGGYLSEAEAAGRDAEALLPLVFLPGFSTAGRVSEISGRGIGLDIVKSTVERMKGSLSLASIPGAGTRLTVRLPMTLAILRVLMVEAAGQSFAVPLAAVSQILRLARPEIEQVGRDPVVRVGGRVVPLLTLARALRLPDSAGEGPERVPVLLLALGEREHGLAVDRLIEAREVVVKPLGPHLSRVRGITGATLMGDGRVVLIVNPAELPEAQRWERAAAAPALPRPAPLATAAQRLELLIVDDSLSVRRVLANLVRSVGWSPILARDGVEALEILQHGARTPDAILLDLEMPRMDGYELAAMLKAQDAFRRIPIVVVTSRAGDKHRERARTLGIDDYLVKPYQDEALIAAVRRVTSEGAGAAAS